MFQYFKQASVTVYFIEELQIFKIALRTCIRFFLNRKNELIREEYFQHVSSQKLLNAVNKSDIWSLNWNMKVRLISIDMLPCKQYSICIYIYVYIPTYKCRFSKTASVINIGIYEHEHRISL